MVEMSQMTISTLKTPTFYLHCYVDFTLLREFLHVDDLADAVVFLLENYSDLEHANVGNGKEVSIKELAELVKDVLGLKWELVRDMSKPDGTPRKLMDNLKITPKISLRDGLVDTYKWYVENYGKQYCR
ncbi:putative GDP-L-fucose synthase 1 [Capsicum annuum]|uniref:probable GDP-L-fucose synthase 1 n=1 Tax=Capsicum annuum TaxID=4072 RepID=UPI001FB0F5A8|nr:probable GDP-L-fucose synthase 1 [Capsicum annuum]